MKIALVCPYDLRRPGGVRSHIVGLGEALVARGHVVEIIAPLSSRAASEACPERSRRGPGLVAQTSLPVVACGSARHLGFGGTQIDITWASPSEVSAAVQRGYDVMHFHTIWNPFVPFQLAAAYRGPKVATFHDVPGPDTPAVAAAMMRPAAELIRRLALRRVIAVSPAVSRYLAGEHVVIPNGVSVPDPLPPIGEREALLYVGRLEPRKNVSTLIAAVAMLGDSAPPLWIAGDGPLRETLEKQATGNVHFFGEVTEDEKWALLRRAKLFVAPAVGGESFGIVLVEAMAAGAPPVAADNPGYQGVLAANESDLLFRAGDPSSLVSRLSSLLTDNSKVDALRDWGEREWRRYDWNALAPAIEAEYRAAITTPS
jgi:phosphatidylinositol alpha-mannosyltransferase